jgi:hypothetical protein
MNFYGDAVAEFLLQAVLQVRRGSAAGVGFRKHNLPFESVWKDSCQKIAHLDYVGNSLSSYLCRTCAFWYHDAFKGYVWRFAIVFSGHPAPFQLVIFVERGTSQDIVLVVMFSRYKSFLYNLRLTKLSNSCSPFCRQAASNLHMSLAKVLFLGFGIWAVSMSAPSISAQESTPHPIHLANGKTLTLSLPSSFKIDVAAQGLKCVRFMAMSPDHRIFVTDMYDRADNSRGRVYILDGWDEKNHKFNKITPYLKSLRNPNNLAFYTEPAQNGKPAQSWLYPPPTGRVMRSQAKNW